MVVAMTSIGRLRFGLAQRMKKHRWRNDDDDADDDGVAIAATDDDV